MHIQEKNLLSLQEKKNIGPTLSPSKQTEFFF